MALPTVRHTNVTAAAGSATLTAFMTKFHAEAILAGWSIEYADADAIGTGSAGTPAWDKTPATSTDGGIAVYQMPANGFTTEWFVRVRPGWALATLRPHMRGLTIGTTHDGSGGVTGGASELVPAVGGNNTDALQYQLSISEDGFALVIGGNDGRPVVIAERARRSDTGVVTDDMIAFNSYTTPAHALIRAGVGLVHSSTPVAFTSFVAPASFGAGVSLANYDSSFVPICGPFWVRGRPFFHGRHAFLLSVADSAINTNRGIFIDGGSKTYRTMGAAHVADWLVWAAATQ